MDDEFETMMNRQVKIFEVLASVARPSPYQYQELCRVVNDIDLWLRENIERRLEDGGRAAKREREET